ncbi:MAG: hypothetical protein P1V81_03585 [Planctomycetota bacterium]|nr:hypothetical protein [Planctomycetota bacterium]
MMALQGQASSPEAPVVLEEALELAGSEELRHLYKSDGPSWLDGLDLSWLPEWDWLDGSIAGYLFWSVLVLLLLWGVYLLVRTFLGRPRKEEQQEPVEQRRLVIAEELRAAARYRAEGDLALALRHYWMALVVGLGRGKAVAYRPAWTCREMLARSKQGTEEYQLLHELLPRIERLEFGKLPIAASDVDELAAICEARLGRELAREEATG